MMTIEMRKDWKGNFEFPHLLMGEGGSDDFYMCWGTRLIPRDFELYGDKYCPKGKEYDAVRIENGFFMDADTLETGTRVLEDGTVEKGKFDKDGRLKKGVRVRDDGVQEGDFNSKGELIRGTSIDECGNVYNVHSDNKTGEICSQIVMPSS
jgi:hypothetical protein